MPPLSHRDTFQHYVIRSWQPTDRQAVGQLIAAVLAEYGLGWDPQGSDRDAIDVETFYWQPGGEFWVVEALGQVVGSAGYYPTRRGINAVEIRKMYLLPQVRGRGLGRYLLTTLEAAIQQRGFQTIWVETATVLREAVKLYETSGYQPACGVETARCDRSYTKTLNSDLGPGG